LFAWLAFFNSAADATLLRARGCGSLSLPWLVAGWLVGWLAERREKKSKIGSSTVIHICFICMKSRHVPQNLGMRQLFSNFRAGFKGK
jgi:hypothetical protein